MNVLAALDSRLQGKVRLIQVQAKTGRIMSIGKWEKNLVFDTYLNALAVMASGYARGFETLKVGSGTNPNSFNAGGSTIFTQVGNTITASTNFFTSAMTGGIFKYGATGTSNGAEQYITFVNATTATAAGAGMTVAIPTAGAVWMVQQTALQTFILASTSYATGSGQCGATFSGNVATLFRTYTYAQQGTTYSVNEVGYSTSAQGGAICNGRIVLGSTVTVPSTNFLVAQFALTATQSPSAQIAQANVGTGVNTAGTAMLNYWDLGVPNASGTTTNYQAGTFTSNLCDGENSGNRPSFCFYHSSALTLQTSIQTSVAATVAFSTCYRASIAILSNASQPVGVGVSTSSYSFTSAGETCTAFIVGGASVNQQLIYVINLTTPFTLPTGSLQGTITWQQTWGRTLVN